MSGKAYYKQLKSKALIIRKDVIALAVSAAPCKEAKGWLKILPNIQNIAIVTSEHSGACWKLGKKQNYLL
ncbi:MAG: hypothetical protein IIX71_09180, partial [Ruminococcus sp.]|nr:hypothetical protein [Ruminococcus sp.]